MAILSMKRKTNWRAVSIIVCSALALAYVAFEVGQQNVEFVPQEPTIVRVPVVSPPGPDAEPIVPLDGPAPALAVMRALPAPELTPAFIPAPDVPPEQDTPRPPITAAVTAMMKKTYACKHARVGGADAAIMRIVERDGTISAAMMERLRSFEDRCLSP